MSSEYKRVRDYELMVIFHPELSEEDIASEVQRVEANVAAVDGTVRLVNRETPWGRRRLAYPIRHGSRDVRDGVYVLYYLTTESGRLADLEREIKLNDRIIRHLLTQQTTPMMEPVVEEEEAAAAATGEAPAAETASAGEAEVETPAAEAPEATPAAELEAEQPAEPAAEVAEAPVAEEAQASELEVETTESSDDTAATETAEETEESPA
jgi:small subunit ribosomal protein S6